eukprot:7917662-Pyramimonas_sp.AAC.1
MRLPVSPGAAGIHASSLSNSARRGQSLCPPERTSAFSLKNQRARAWRMFAGYLRGAGLRPPILPCKLRPTPRQGLATPRRQQGIAIDGREHLCRGVLPPAHPWHGCAGGPPTIPTCNNAGQWQPA